MNKWERIIQGLAPAPSFMTEAVTALEEIGYKEDADPYNWVPTEIARAELAKRYPLLLKPYDDRPNGVQLFGITLHLCLPNTEKVVRRVGGGRKVRGYAGAIGPGHLRSLDPSEGYLQWFRPKVNDAKNARDTGKSPS